MVMKVRRCHFRTCGKITLVWVLTAVVFIQYSITRQKAVQQCRNERAENTQDNLLRTADSPGHQNITTAIKYPYKTQCDPRTAATIIGYQRNTVGYMTIGISSIFRPNTTNGTGYLNRTISSLIKNLRPHEQSEITIIVFLSDFNRSFTDAMIKRFQKDFQSQLSSGLLMLFTLPAHCYPRLDGLTRTYNDAPGRVKWRSKQVVDYAFLWQFSANRSIYYMQLEDDVITCLDYVSKIKQFVESQNSMWTLLEFSKLGYIGKFYKSTDLNRLADFVLTFYYNMPIDWLLPYFTKLMVQNRPIHAEPPLFNHIGRRSSLGGTYNPLIEETFCNVTAAQQKS